MAYGATLSVVACSVGIPHGCWLFHSQSNSLTICLEIRQKIVPGHVHTCGRSGEVSVLTLSYSQLYSHIGIETVDGKSLSASSSLSL